MMLFFVLPKRIDWMTMPMYVCVFCMVVFLFGYRLRSRSRSLRRLR